jgi:CCR4-NOT transcriptional regulation complex NOT5 subunit
MTCRASSDHVSQRHEEPKDITNDGEFGSYVYFDYETVRAAFVGVVVRRARDSCHVYT